jgi:hypothetical protein
VCRYGKKSPLAADQDGAQVAMANISRIDKAVSVDASGERSVDA